VGAGTYATVSTVSAPSLLRGLVDLDVLDNQVGGVETLGVGVGLGVLKKTDEDLSRLDGPAGLGDTESLACGGQPESMQDCPSRCAMPTPQILLFQCVPVLNPVRACMRACVQTQEGDSPCAVRPVDPAYRLMGMASLCSRTLPR
jgi:hypothetical protein